MLEGEGAYVFLARDQKYILLEIRHQNRHQFNGMGSRPTVKLLILLEASTRIELVYTDLQD